MTPHLGNDNHSSKFGRPRYSIMSIESVSTGFIPGLWAAIGCSADTMTVVHAHLKSVCYSDANQMTNKWDAQGKLVPQHLSGNKHEWLVWTRDYLSTLWLLGIQNPGGLALCCGAKAAYFLELHDFQHLLHSIPDITFPVTDGLKCQQLLAQYFPHIQMHPKKRSFQLLLCSIALTACLSVTGTPISKMCLSVESSISAFNLTSATNSE
jgi:hypothetical protein